MAVEYYLICEACKEFIDLYKINLLPDAPHPLPAAGITLNKTEPATTLDTFKRTFEGALPDWIEQQVPFVEDFMKDHHGHDLVLKDDYPDPLWYPEMPGYMQWKERQTPLTNELFLPRNLVDDLHITGWSDAESHLKGMHVILIEDLDLDEYKRVLDDLIQKNRQV